VASEQQLFTIRCPGAGNSFLSDREGRKAYVERRAQAFRFSLDEAWAVIEKFREFSNEVKLPIAEPSQ
jgi:hypothetical protein